MIIFPETAAFHLYLPLLLSKRFGVSQEAMNLNVTELSITPVNSLFPLFFIQQYKRTVEKKGYLISSELCLWELKSSCTLKCISENGTS